MNTPVLVTHPDPVRTRAIEDALRQSGFAPCTPGTTGVKLQVRGEGSAHLRVRLERHSAVLEASASVEEILFWVNELWFSRRRPGGPRCPIELQVVVAHGAQVSHTTTADLSASGLYAVMVDPPVRGAAVGVELYLDDDAPPLRTLGMVVKSVRGEDDLLIDDSGTRTCSHPGAAIDLVGLPDAGRQRLARCVQRALRTRSAQDRSGHAKTPCLPSRARR
ncbi:MAG: PilZ domain-containing protein [Pseudomonadota bacterium]